MFSNHVPPTSAFLSNTVYGMPACSSRIAAQSPPSPAPMMPTWKPARVSASGRSTTRTADGRRRRSRPPPPPAARTPRRPLAGHELDQPVHLGGVGSTCRIASSGRAGERVERPRPDRLGVVGGERSRTAPVVEGARLGMGVDHRQVAAEVGDRGDQHGEVRRGQRCRELPRVDPVHGRPSTPKCSSRTLNASLVPTLARVLTKLNSSPSKRRLVANACTRKPLASSPT